MSLPALVTFRNERGMRLAHLSDVHLPLPDRVDWRAVLNKRALSLLSWRRKRHLIHRPEVLARLVADIHAAARSDGATPVLIAREILGLSDGDDEIAAAVPRESDDNTPGVAAARLVLRAKQPWSKGNHALFPAPARARAVEFMRLGSMLSRDPRFAGVEMRDIWQAYAVEWVVRHSSTS